MTKTEKPTQHGAWTGTEVGAVRVPDEVDFKLEIEIDDEEKELEIELKW